MNYEQYEPVCSCPVKETRTGRKFRALSSACRSHYCYGLRLYMLRRELHRRAAAVREEIRSWSR